MFRPLNVDDSELTQIIVNKKTGITSSMYKNAVKFKVDENENGSNLYGEIMKISQQVSVGVRKKLFYLAFLQTLLLSHRDKKS